MYVDILVIYIYKLMRSIIIVYINPQDYSINPQDYMKDPEIIIIIIYSLDNQNKNMISHFHFIL